MRLVCWYEMVKKISRILLSVLNYLNSSMFWMISIFATDLWFPQTLSHVNGDHFKGNSYYNWYYHHLNIPQLFQLSGKIQVFVCLFTFFYFHSMVRIGWSVDILKSWRILWVIFSDRFWFVQKLMGRGWLQNRISSNVTWPLLMKKEKKEGTT